MSEDIQKKAVALKYRKGVDSAPRVVAKGRGIVAENIIKIAKENGVPIHEDCDLVQLLSALDIYEHIPSELYKAVAETLVFIYRVKKSIQY